MTHGGYGVGSALETVRQLAPDSPMAEPFIIECDQERRQLEQLDNWFTSLGIEL